MEPQKNPRGGMQVIPRPKSWRLGDASPWFKSKDKNIVYWNPNLFIPRNKVTYLSNFEVREYWGSENLEKILNEADFYVTNTDLYLDNVNKIKINNFYIFFY